MSETYPPALPVSDALSEAQPESIQELFSRNPEYLADRNYDQIILNMRDLRQRLEATATPIRHARVKDPNAPTPKPRGKKTLDFDEDFFDEA